MQRSEALNLRSLANAVISAPLLSFTSQTPTSFAFSPFATGKFYSFSFSRRNVRSITCETSNFYRRIPPTFLFYIHACNYPFYTVLASCRRTSACAHHFYVLRTRWSTILLRGRCVMCTSTGLSMLVASSFLRDTLSQRYSLHGLQQVGTTGFRGRMCRKGKYTWRIRVYHKNTVI